jgi:myxalamid-type polyketide synthase MxaE and MxaD
VEPAVVIGHSVGEYAAACVAGVMDVDDALRLIAARGRLMHERTARGAMAAVFADEATVAAAVAPHGRTLALAAVNAPDSVVVAGEAAALAALLEALDARGIRSRRLEVSHAFHSPLMDPMLDEFARVAATVSYRPPRLPLVSNVTGALAGAEVATPDYWVRHVRQPVQFAAGVRTLLERGPRVLLEVGPGTTLLGLARRAAGEAAFEAVPTLRQGRESLAVAEAVARLWTVGVAIDWTRHHADAGGRHIDLPTYPFQRERHWAAVRSSAPVRTAVRRDAGAHPLLGHRLVEAGAAAVGVWEGAVDLATFPYLVDHRVQGRVIVPATAYLEMAIAAGVETLGARPLTLGRIKLHAPLALDPDTEARTQTVLTGSPDGGLAFAVQSRKVGAAGVDAGPWTLHATGRLAAADEGEVTLDLEAIRARCPDEVTGEDFYRRLAERGNDWGPCFRGVARVWRGPDEAIAEVRAPAAVAGDLEHYRFHPALADAAGHALAATIPLERSTGPRGGAFVGGALDRFVFRRAPKGRLFSHARRRDGGGPGNVLAGDVRLVDETGAVVAEVQGARLWYLDEGVPEIAEDTLARRLYGIEWRHQPLAAAAAAGHERWLVFADGDGVGAAVAARLSAGSVLVEPGDRYEQRQPDRFLVRPGERDDVRRLLADVLGGAGCAGIVHLWSLDGKVGPDAAAADLDAAQRLGCGSILPLVQELAAARRPGRLPLWLVTRGAQPAGGVLAPETLTAATVWGLGRTLSAEHADLWGGLVDLDPAAPAEDAATLLVAQLRAADGEDQVAFRRGERLVARLIRTPTPGAARAARWRADASYLVAGGLGGLGLQVARWMIEQGARRLVLLGRSGLPPRAEWGALDPGSRVGRRTAAVRALEALGASVHLAPVDVTDEAALREFLDAFQREGWPPIRGVVHAAGTVHYGPLVQTTPAQLDEVLRSKVTGAWLLHRLLADEPLDFFVLFASASGVLSSPLVGGYAAANAFLDALAYRRASEGRPALSVDWGLWAGAGMAELVDAEGLAALTARGMGSLAPEQALEALGVLLRSPAVQAGVIPVNWPVWRERYPMFTATPFLAEVLAGETPVAATPAAAAAREDLLALEPAARAEAVRERLRAHAGAVLRLDPATLDIREPLTAFGIDSLMAVELKNRVDRDLGLSVPLVHYLDGSGIERLAEVLLDSVGPVAAGAAGEEGALLAQLPEMSDAEVDALLKRMLAEREGS